jgi:trimethylamine--corrinoid protein Co-methyltransferase
MENVARPRLTLLTNDQIAAVHEASLVILAGSGLRVDSERARRVYAAGGASIENDRVFLARELVDAAIESAPATIDLFDRAGQPAFRLGDGETRFGVGVTNLFIRSRRPTSSPFSRSHMERSVRLCQALPSYDVISTSGSFAICRPRWRTSTRS